MKTFICKDKTENLCETCGFCIPVCDQDVEFGNGIGNDNVIECSGYSPIGEMPDGIIETEKE